MVELSIKDVIDFSRYYDFSVIESNRAFEIFESNDSKENVKLVNVTYRVICDTGKEALNRLKQSIEMMLDSVESTIYDYDEFEAVVLNRRNVFVEHEGGRYYASWRGLITKIPSTYKFTAAVY